MHALPQAKRRPQTAAERQVVLQRANVLANALFPGGGPIWLCAPRFSDRPGPQARLTDQMDRAMTWRDPQDHPEEAVETTFYVAQSQWLPGALDDVFMQIAQGDTMALIFAPQTGHVLAPYEGGFDIVLAAPDEAAGIEARFPDWRSDRPDKL
jgi:hypothetical protein